MTRRFSGTETLELVAGTESPELVAVPLLPQCPAPKKSRRKAETATLESPAPKKSRQKAATATLEMTCLYANYVWVPVLPLAINV